MLKTRAHHCSSYKKKKSIKKGTAIIVFSSFFVVGAIDKKRIKSSFMKRND